MVKVFNLCFRVSVLNVINPTVDNNIGVRSAEIWLEVANGRSPKLLAGHELPKCVSLIGAKSKKASVRVIIGITRSVRLPISIKLPEW